MQLAQSLTQDFIKEGYLLKTGPKSSDGFKKRWFTLDGRKFMYHEQPLVSSWTFQRIIYCAVDIHIFYMDVVELWLLLCFFAFAAARMLIQRERSSSATSAMVSLWRRVCRSAGKFAIMVSCSHLKHLHDPSYCRPTARTTVTSGSASCRPSWIDLWLRRILSVGPTWNRPGSEIRFSSFFPPHYYYLKLKCMPSSVVKSLTLLPLLKFFLTACL